MCISANIARRAGNTGPRTGLKGGWVEKDNK